MAKRGRPNNNGVKPGWVLLRIVMVLHAYDQARGRGEKRSAAISDAVSTVRSLAPEMPISETEVKRVLAEFRSEKYAETFIFRKRIAPGHEVDDWFDMLKWVAKESHGKWEVPAFSDDEARPKQLRTFRIDVGPPPSYPRHNSRI